MFPVVVIIKKLLNMLACPWVHSHTYFSRVYT